MTKQSEVEKAGSAGNYVLFAALAACLAFIVIGVLKARSAGEAPPVVLPPNGEFLFVGLGGLLIAAAVKLRAGDTALVVVLIRAVLIEFGVLLGFAATYLTFTLWPVVTVGSAGMIGVMTLLRDGEPADGA